MSHNEKNENNSEKVANIIRDAGGRVVGRTRLQKIAYLLEISGLGEGFSFEYRHYGPFSEELTNAAWRETLSGLICEEEKPTSWGGSYSIFIATGEPKQPAVKARADLIKEAVSVDSVALELAATAAFLAKEGNQDPWAETSRRKPEKASLKLTQAKSLYQKLQSLNTPVPLPAIA